MWRNWKKWKKMKGMKGMKGIFLSFLWFLFIPQFIGTGENIDTWALAFFKHNTSSIATLSWHPLFHIQEIGGRPFLKQKILKLHCNIDIQTWSYFISGYHDKCSIKVLYNKVHKNQQGEDGFEMDFFLSWTI